MWFCVARRVLEKRCLISLCTASAIVVEMKESKLLDSWLDSWLLLHHLGKHIPQTSIWSFGLFALKQDFGDYKIFFLVIFQISPKMSPADLHFTSSTWLQNYNNMLYNWRHLSQWGTLQEVGATLSDGQNI